jgi:hypothetical protein
MSKSEGGVPTDTSHASSIMKEFYCNYGEHYNSRSKGVKTGREGPQIILARRSQRVDDQHEEMEVHSIRPDAAWELFWLESEQGVRHPVFDEARLEGIEVLAKSVKRDEPKGTSWHRYQAGSAPTIRVVRKPRGGHPCRRDDQ